MRLTSPAGSAAFSVVIRTGPALTFDIANGAGASRTYGFGDRSQSAYLDVFEALSRDMGLRRPMARQPPVADTGPASLRSILTSPVSPDILYGYGDPCVVQVAADDYRLLVTSNDAPDAFPILASTDLEAWTHAGFVFPRGRTPSWALAGPGVSDFWAPELHRVGAEWWVCFTARRHTGELAIGIARSPSPDGPFHPDPAPIVTGGVIDSHILIDAESQPWLVWKKDDNDVWPGRLSALLHDQPQLIAELFDAEEDRRTAAFVVTLWPWVSTLAPMEQFFVQQPLIEAVAADLAEVMARLAFLRERLPPRSARACDEIVASLRTRIYAQRIAADGLGLEGQAAAILENDLPWEGHLIEGVWITHEDGRYYLLYAGNDFSTALYGIGAAVADHPAGPYRKAEEVFLRSGAQWWGPGHPSVVTAPDGGRRIFLHAFRPGEAGYKAFRALLTAPIVLRGGAIRLGD